MGCTNIKDNFDKQKHLIENKIAEIKKLSKSAQSQMGSISTMQSGAQKLQKCSEIAQEVPEDFKKLQEILNQQKASGTPEEKEDIARKEADLEVISKKIDSELGEAMLSAAMGGLAGAMGNLKELM